jgi:hypothetical protein
MNELEKFNQLLVKFMDPLINNKTDLLSEIQPLFKQLLINSEITYYCSKCQENHFTGLKYQSHKKYIKISPTFPNIPTYLPDIVRFVQIVGVYYANSGSLLKRLPKGTIFKLKTEPKNQHDSHAVSVWHGKKKLGYIPRSSNIEVFNALSNGKVTCIFGKYRPSFSRRSSRSYYNEEGSFRPERADITIHLFNSQMFHDLMKGFIGMISVSNNYTDYQDKIVEVLYDLGYRAIKILENQRQTEIMKEILSKLYDKFKIQIKDSEFSILL